MKREWQIRNLKNAVKKEGWKVNEEWQINIKKYGEEKTKNSELRTQNLKKHS